MHWSRACSGLESVCCWYVAVYWDGIGAGVTAGAARRGGGASDGADDADADADSSSLSLTLSYWPEHTPKAYLIDIVLGGGMLIMYVAYT